MRKLLIFPRAKYKKLWNSASASSIPADKYKYLAAHVRGGIVCLCVCVCVWVWVKRERERDQL